MPIVTPLLLCAGTPPLVSKPVDPGCTSPAPVPAPQRNRPHSTLSETVCIFVQKSVQIRTEAGPRLHIEPPVDYSDDFELCGDVTVQANNTSEDRPQVGMTLALRSGHLKDGEAQCCSGLSGHFLTFIYSVLHSPLCSFTLAFISHSSMSRPWARGQHSEAPSDQGSVSPGSDL